MTIYHIIHHLILCKIVLKVLASSLWEVRPSQSLGKRIWHIATIYFDPLNY